MPKETKLARISIRAHQLAERKSIPAGNRARAIEFALELALIVEYRGPNREVGEGLDDATRVGRACGSFITRG